MEKLDDDAYQTVLGSALGPGVNARTMRLAALVLLPSPDGIGACSAVIELDYVDRDLNIAFAQLHARAFRDFPRRTIRVHFFNKAVNFDDLLNDQVLRQSYLGYIVLTHNPQRPIGRTVLPAPLATAAVLSLPCQESFSVNLAGVQLNARGTAFVEQDGRVAACATASIWMSTVIASKRFHADIFPQSTTEITESATRHSLPGDGRGSPPGLSLEQMLLALNGIGCEPVLHFASDPAEIEAIIFRYVDSGIPPVLVIKLPNAGAGGAYHAITVVGHAADASHDPMQKLGAGIQSTNAWCTHFLIHDDQMGMYLKIKIGPVNRSDPPRPTIHFDGSAYSMQPYVASITDWYQNASLFAVMVPMPPRHPLKSKEADLKGRELIETAFRLYKPQIGELPSPMAYRTFFVASNEFKKQFFPSASPNLSSELSAWYRGSTYPRYIWVTQLCTFDPNGSRTLRDLRVVADVVLDPTSSYLSPDFITLHVPGLFFRMPPNQANVAEILATAAASVPGDAPYAPVISV